MPERRGAQRPAIDRCRFHWETSGTVVRCQNPDGHEGRHEWAYRDAWSWRLDESMGWWVAAEDLTAEKQRLYEAAVQGVAWALIQNETDTADRGVSPEHYQSAITEARRLLPTIASLEQPRGQ